MNTEDLAPLLAAIGEEPDVGYHSGRVVSWDPVTGANTIDVAGGLIPNLPMLNIGDTINLAIGDTVGVLRYRSTYFILGRVTVPGSDILATQAVEFFADTESAGGYAITTTEATVVTVTVPVPVWANRAIVHANLHTTGRNTTGAVDFLYASVAIAGAGGAQQFNQADAPNPSYCETSASHARTGITIPGTEFVVTGRVNSINGNWAANGLNQADLTVSVTHTRAPE